MKSFQLLGLIWLTMLICLTQRAADITAGNVVGTPGSLVDLPIQIDGGNDTVAQVQFIIQYDSNQIEAESPALSSLPDEFVYSGEAPGGIRSVFLYSGIDAPIPNGATVHVPFSIPIGAEAGELPITLSAVVFSGPLGHNISPVRITNGSVTVQKEGSIRLGLPIPQPAGGVQFNVDGDSGVYAVEVSANLRAWTPLATIDLPGGIYTYTDNSTVGNRFYRARITGPSQLFQFHAQGLKLTVDAGAFADASGKLVPAAGSTASLPANNTNYVFFDLGDGTIQFSIRNIHRGGILLGAAITGSNGVASISQPPRFELPTTRIPKTKAKIANREPVLVGVIGDSITDGAGLPQPNMQYAYLVFSTNAATTGFQVPNVTNVTLWVYAVPASSPAVGMLYASTVTPNPSRVTDSSRAGYSRGPYNNQHASDSKFAGTNLFARTIPDLVILAIGTGGYYRSPQTAIDIEASARVWRSLGAEVILTTQNQAVGASGPLFELDPAPYDEAAQNSGAELADTYGYVEWAHANYLQGNGPDSHIGAINAIHPNQYGHQLYARAIRGLLSDYNQRDESTFDPLPGQAPIYNGVTQTRWNWVDFQVELGTGASATASIHRGSVSGVTIVSPGVDMVQVPTIQFYGGGGSGAAATAGMVAMSGTAANLGSGYTLNDQVTMLGGVGSSPIFIVSGINSTGGVTQLTLLGKGNLSSIGSNPHPVLGGSGSDLAIAATFRLGYVNVTSIGSGYTNPPTVAISGGQLPGPGAFGSGFAASPPITAPYSTTLATFNPAVNLTGATYPAAYCLRVNDYIEFSHGNAVDASLIYSLPTGAQATYKIISGGVELPHPGILAGLGFPYMDPLTQDLRGHALPLAANTNSFLSPASFRFVLATLTNADFLTVYGAAFRTHRWTDIPFEAMQFQGNWAAEPGYWDSPNVYYTDTPQASVTIPFTKDYLEVFLQAGVENGQSTATFNGYVDGEQVFANTALNRFGTGHVIFNAYFQRGNPTGSKPLYQPHGAHTAVLTLATPETAPTPQSRSLAIIGARDVDTR